MYIATPVQPIPNQQNGKPTIKKLVPNQVQNKKAEKPVIKYFAVAGAPDPSGGGRGGNGKPDYRIFKEPMSEFKIRMMDYASRANNIVRKKIQSFLMYNKNIKLLLYIKLAQNS